MPFIPPMLATRLEDPRKLTDPRYLAEPKLDGQHAQVHVRGGRARSNQRLLRPARVGVERSARQRLLGDRLSLGQRLWSGKACGPERDLAGSREP